MREVCAREPVRVARLADRLGEDAERAMARLVAQPKGMRGRPGRLR